MAKLPNKLFVYVEQDGKEKYYIANTTIAETAERNQVVVVGIYELKQVCKVETKVVTTPIKQ